MEKWLRSLVNPQTIILLFTSVVSCAVTLHYDLRIHNGMMLFGLIVSFPLVFSLQSAFKTRDRAIEYLSMYQAAMNAIHNAIMSRPGISAEVKDKGTSLIASVHTNFISYLGRRGDQAEKILSDFHRLPDFFAKEKEEIGSKLLDRLGRYLKDANNAAYYLVSVKNHGTVVAVRWLSYVLVNLFPLIQAAFLRDSFSHLPPITIYIVSCFTSLALAVLLLIQKQLEDPFDQDGLDDIQLKLFSLPGR